MKILIVNRFFGGAQIPTGRMAEDVARVLVAEGHEVCALASSGTYAGAEKRAQHGAWSMEHGASGTETLKNRITEPRLGETAPRQPPGPSGRLRVETVAIPKWMPRALAWVWFTWQARKRIPRMDWDVCVLMTDPPLLPLLVPRAKAAGVSVEQCFGKAVEDTELKNGKTEIPPHRATRRVAVWLMDLYPEALAASGRLSETNPIYRWYFEKRQRALGAADLLICLGEAQEKRARMDNRTTGHQDHGTAVSTETLKHRNTEPPGAPGPRTVVVPPWDDRGNIALATEESLRNLALYAGNLGEAHCFEEILAAVPHLPGDWKVRFAVRGAKFAGLKAAANELNSRSEAQTARGAAEGKPRDQETKRPEAVVEVTGYASEEETPGLLASARVHLITMSPGWEGIVVPSKLYGCVRTGRPVLFVGPENADTAREILRNDWGKVLPPSTDGREVAAAILELAARPTHAVRPQQGAGEIAALLVAAAGLQD